MKQTTPSYIKVISKTTPIQVVPVKNEPGTNNRGEKIIYQLRHVINSEAIIGINRLYLLNHRRLYWFLHLLSICLIAVTVYRSIENKYSSNAGYAVILDTTYVEYICLVLISILSKKSRFNEFFADLESFDNLMNLSNDLEVICPAFRGLLWITSSVLYSIIEYLVLWLLLPEVVDSSFTLTYITFLAHDYEGVLFCTLLRTILLRLYVIKAHVVKIFPNVEARKKFSKVEELSKNVQLDISSLHRNYELLHECSEQLNKIMSFPMMIMLFSSGLATTMMLRNVFKTLQRTEVTELARGIIAYISCRCLRCTILMIIPCYYSSVTTTQVFHIRTMLHDAMNQVNIGKLDRRRLKAFFHLTRENEFAYALWGLIRLNMSLPLNYLSLCTTYLVIIIQFSKFID